MLKHKSNLPPTTLWSPVLLTCSSSSRRAVPVHRGVQNTAPSTYTVTAGAWELEFYSLRALRRLINIVLLMEADTSSAAPRKESFFSAPSQHPTRRQHLPPRTEQAKTGWLMWGETGSFLYPQALLVAVLGYTRPHYIPLAHVPYSFGAVYQMMDLTFQDRFEVGLHLTTRDLDPYAEREDSAFRHIVHVGSQNLDLAVVYRIEIDARHKLECYGLVSAELDPRVLFPYTLALERGAVRHRDRDLRYLDLAASDLKRFFNHLVIGHA